MGTENTRRKKDALKRARNNVRKLREQLLMSKAELAKAAGLSVLTVDRVEHGQSCRMSTKRKIIKALGLNLGDKDRVFGG
jgi:DNA-binding XRE family transcriptional regulator